MLGHYVVAGIPFGCVYALVGLGLVITYRAAGVFNFAFGAQAYVSAAVFYVTVKQDHWPVWAGGVVAIVVTGAGLGLVLDRGLFRFLRQAPLLVRLVISLGLLIGIPAVVQAAGFGAGARLAPPALGPTPPGLFSGLGVTLDTNELAVVVATAVVGLSLGAVFSWTALGLRLRAVVESPRLAQLAGVNVAAVSSWAWIISSVVAGLAGVLLAPLYGRVDPNDFDLLVVAAMAAAAFGGLSSLSMTVAGGLVLGIGQQLIAGYLPLGSALAQGLRPSLPFILLLLVLIAAGPALDRRDRRVDPMAGVDPPPAQPASVVLGYGIGPRQVVAAVVAGLVAVVFLVAVLPAYWLFLATQAAAMSVVFLSFTVLTGMSGQLSLCQAELAGIGAFAAGQLANHLDLSVIAGLAVGFVLAGCIGLVAAVPAFRVGGLYLALATFAFGLLIDNIGFIQTWAGNGTTGITVPRPLIGSLSFTPTAPFFVLAAVVLALVAAGVALLRRSTVGQYLGAVRGSELAAASVGIDTRRVKLVAFALSAGVAGLGGALIGSTLGAISASNFTFYQSLFWLVIVAITGVRTIGGAVGAGVAVVVVPQLLSLGSGGLGALASVIFGFGALSYIRHPEGLVPWLRHLASEGLPEAGARSRRKPREHGEVTG